MFSSVITTRGHEPSSTAEEIIYGSDWAGVPTTGTLIQETGHPLLVTTRGKAPQSTAQLKMYPLKYTEQNTEEIESSEKANQSLELSAIEFDTSFKYKDDFSFHGMNFTYVRIRRYIVLIGFTCLYLHHVLAYIHTPSTN